MQKEGIEIWIKPILPKSGTKYSWAVAVLNRRVDGTPSQVTVPLRDLGLDFADGYRVRDLYQHKDIGVLLPDAAIQVDVNPTGKILAGHLENRKKNRLVIVLFMYRCCVAQMFHGASTTRLMNERCFPACPNDTII